MSDLRSLIEAAKADGPSAAARAKVWVGVSKTVGGVASLAGASAVTASASAAKMLIMGALLGGTVTVGVGAAMLVVRSAPHGKTAAAAAFATPAPAAAESTFLPRPAPIEEPATVEAIEGARATQEPGANPEPGASPEPSTFVAAGSATPDVGSGAGSGSGSAMQVSLVERGVTGKRTPFHTATARAGQDDPLTREASLLASARNALVRQDALSALQIVRGLRTLPARQLMPEELAVEAQSLRSLGLDAEADAVEARLRTQFPDSVLGR